MRIPKGLGADGRALFRAVDSYLTAQDPPMELEPHEEVILLEAARLSDRLCQLREVLAEADLSEPVNVRLLAEERQQRVALSTLLVSKLGLPTGVAGESPRTRRARTAAGARWEQAPTGSAVSDAARTAAAARWRR